MRFVACRCNDEADSCIQRNHTAWSRITVLWKRKCTTKNNLKPFTFYICNWQRSSRQLHHCLWFFLNLLYIIFSSLQVKQIFCLFSFSLSLNSCTTESHSLILCALLKLQMYVNYFSAFSHRSDSMWGWVIKHCFCLTDHLLVSSLCVVIFHSLLVCHVLLYVYCFYQCEYDCSGFVCEFKFVEYHSHVRWASLVRIYDARSALRGFLHHSLKWKIIITNFIISLFYFLKHKFTCDFPNISFRNVSHRKIRSFLQFFFSRLTDFK